MRYSSRREAVLSALKSTKSHPDAEWVYKRVRRVHPNVSLGTVYRNLRELSASGEIATLETEFGSLHFDADTSSHAHFVCSECGRITDLAESDSLAESLTERGYFVKQTKTVVYGVCPECSAAK